MKKEMFLLLVVFSAFVFNSKAQNILDTAKIEYSIKINTINFKNKLIDSNQILVIDSLVTSSDFFKLKTLKKDKFENFLFYQVSFAEADFWEYVQKRKFNGVPFYNEFVLAFNTKTRKILNIKGFVNNEFSKLLEENYRTASPLERLNLDEKHYFLNNYSVETLDIECLLQASNLKKRYRKDEAFYNEYECLKPSVSRMIFINGLAEEL